MSKDGRRTRKRVVTVAAVGTTSCPHGQTAVSKALVKVAVGFAKLRYVPPAGFYASLAAVVARSSTQSEGDKR